MSDLIDGNQSRLRAAHRYLTENDGLYRASIVAAPVALAVAFATTMAIFIWSPPSPLPPPAVPAPQSTQPAPPAPQSPARPPAAPTVDLKTLRDRATSDTTALNDLRTRADAGDAMAQFYMATLYDPRIPSVSFQKDAAAAVAWYRKSADQGHEMAEFNLANFYEWGEGVGQDDAQAALWYQKSADQGFAAAQYQLGRLYYLGHGVAKDDAEAARWYWKAADQGDYNAENELGTLYASGDGVPLDFKQAVALFRRAVQVGPAAGVVQPRFVLRQRLGDAAQSHCRVPMVCHNRALVRRERSRKSGDRSRPALRRDLAGGASGGKSGGGKLEARVSRSYRGCNCRSDPGGSKINRQPSDERGRDPQRRKRESGGHGRIATGRRNHGRRRSTRQRPSLASQPDQRQRPGADCGIAGREVRFSGFVAARPRRGRCNDQPSMKFA